MPELKLMTAVERARLFRDGSDGRKERRAFGNIKICLFKKQSSIETILLPTGDADHAYSIFSARKRLYSLGSLE